MAPNKNSSGMVNSSRHKLLALARKRLQRFATLMPKLLIADDANLVHDLRVWSRRLQQALRVLYPGAKPPKSKKLRRSLRRVRQALGPCRNLDVDLELVRKRRQQAGASAVQHAWAALQTGLEAKRGPLIESARHEVARHDLFSLIARAKALIDAADQDACEGSSGANGPEQSLGLARIENLGGSQPERESDYGHRHFDPHIEDRDYMTLDVELQQQQTEKKQQI